ncbi:MAG: helix-turn-helix domain-containing protein [Butyricicoccaceae bacterium]
MSEITKIVGERLRAQRMAKGLSQEATAERASLHPTYIGQLERGEKNATIESLEKVCRALELPLEQLFEHLLPQDAEQTSASQAYDLIRSRPPEEQEQLLHLLRAIAHYKDG